MQKCPICGGEIEYLAYNSKEVVTACFDYDKKSDECSYSGWGSIGMPEGVDTCYSCSECGGFLFNKKTEAKEFLKSGELPEHRIPYFVERKLSR